MASNYPPGVTGSEPEIAGDASGDEANFGSVRYGIERALALLNSGTTAYVVAEKLDEVERHLREALADLDVLEIQASEEPELEPLEEIAHTEEVAITTPDPYGDLRILEIPLEPIHRKNILGFPYDESRYAIVGVPELFFSEDDRLSIQRILYALRIRPLEEAPE